MKSQNGVEYTQNYDLIVKRIGMVLYGETLEVIGVKTGRIQEVFGFEPADISVRAGRIDLMARDETGAMFHIEEERNLKRSDLYRFAAYHFLGAKQWGDQVTDIILASGDVYSGNKEIITTSGKYSPIVIDFSQRNGKKRLAEIRSDIQAGTFNNWLELVFLPIYGKETGFVRSVLVEEILRFESQLYHEGKISATLLAAAVIMSNKLIEKERLKSLWEEIKMLDIFEIAKEEGLKEGKILGILEATQELLMDALIERFNAVSKKIIDQIKAMQSPDVLKLLHRQALKCQNIQEFESILQQMA